MVVVEGPQANAERARKAIEEIVGTLSCQAGERLSSLAGIPLID